MPRQNYRPVTADYQYLHNWVDKLNLLCIPTSEVGLIGSCYFIGILLSIYFVPSLADKNGRVPYVMYAFAL